MECSALRRAEIATGNLDDAFDILQDAILKLAAHYDDRPSREWPALFYRIVQNGIRDWGRQQKLRKALFWFSSGDDNPIDDTAAITSHQPDTSTQTTAAIKHLELALRDLPERQQQVFLLRAWEGLDTQATADAMSISTGSVKTHYSRALTKLRQQLGEHWP